MNNSTTYPAGTPVVVTPTNRRNKPYTARFVRRAQRGSSNAQIVTDETNCLRWVRIERIRLPGEPPPPPRVGASSGQAADKRVVAKANRWAPTTHPCPDVGTACTLLDFNRKTTTPVTVHQVDAERGRCLVSTPVRHAWVSADNLRWVTTTGNR